MINLEGTDNYNEIEINDNLTILDLKAYASSILNIAWNQMDIVLNNRTLSNNIIIRDAGIGDNVIVVKKINPPENSIQQRQPSGLGQAFTQFMNNQRSNPYGNLQDSYYGGYDLGNSFAALMNSFRSNSKEQFIKKRVKELQERFLTTPEDLNRLFNTKPELAEAIVSGNDQKVESIVRKEVEENEKEQQNKQMEYIRLMNSDPNDPQVQEKIQKIIQQKNIDENLRQAEEYMPETLFPVHMLFINLEINKKKVVALVDTGAQSTIMSQDLCQKCDLFNLCDTRFSGIAKGVGTSRIIGTVHAAQMKINNKILMAKITVVENKSIGFIFGLDNMRAHRCTIDLNKNGLVFPDIGVTVNFLSDGEIKKIKEEDDLEEEKEEIERAKKASLQK